jgi:hypothetical protein
VVLPGLLYVIVAALASVDKWTYNSEWLHVLSTDGEENLDMSIEIAKELKMIINTENRLPFAELMMGTTRMSICIFPHQGKHECLESTVEHIRQHHQTYYTAPSDIHVHMLDFDTAISEDAIAVSATSSVSTSSISVEVNHTNVLASLLQPRKENR